MSICYRCHGTRLDRDGKPCPLCFATGSLACCEGPTGGADEAGCGGWGPAPEPSTEPEGWQQQDAIGSWEDAIAALRERHLAGMPAHPMFVPSRSPPASD